MGLMSVRDDRRDPSIAKQVAKQREETEQFMREPFEPEPAIGFTRLRRMSRSPIHSLPREKKFMKANPATPATVKTVPEQLPVRNLRARPLKNPRMNCQIYLRHPTPKMIEGEMKPVDVSDEDLKALVAYIKSLK